VLKKPDTMRLFFAAWPPPEAQQALGDLALRLKKECGGRALPAGNIHLTLAFLGETARDLLPRLERLAATVAVPPFDIRFDRVGYWRHNRVVWAGTGQGDAELGELATGLTQALAGEGFRIEKRAFVPHVTLLRNARRAPAVASFPPIAWQVTGHALVESVPIERVRLYRVLRAWPPG
jgi:2'-5' RNA ligase